MPSAPFDPNIQSEKIAFDPDQMIACKGCGRMNPPNRFKCLYCAHELDVPVDAVSLKPVLRKLELWERGFNVLVQEKGSGADVEKIAALFSMEPTAVEEILSAGVPLPLARVDSEKEALFLHTTLEPLGVDCSIVSDAELATDTLPVRLRGLALSDGSITVTEFNTGDERTHDMGELVLAISGSIIQGRVDSLEKRKGGENKVLNETATTSDEAVLDLYTRGDPVGYRINQTGFDFSCLGADKGLLAGENMRQLAVRLKQEAPALKLVNDYPRVRQALAGIWDVESRNDSEGLKRTGIARFGLNRVASTNNLDQFTKYSRLQQHLYETQK
jgi:hypothetical protein